MNSFILWGTTHGEASRCRRFAEWHPFDFFLRVALPQVVMGERLPLRFPVSLAYESNGLCYHLTHNIPARG
jgi:hypothetical protein